MTSKTTNARRVSGKSAAAILEEVSPTEMHQTEVKMALATKISDKMKSLGWGVSFLAQIIDRDEKVIHAWLAGYANVTVDEAVALSRVLNIPLPELFTGSMDKARTPIPKNIGMEASMNVQLLDKTIDRMTGDLEALVTIRNSLAASDTKYLAFGTIQGKYVLHERATSKKLMEGNMDNLNKYLVDNKIPKEDVFLRR